MRLGLIRCVCPLRRDMGSHIGLMERYLGASAAIDPKRNYDTVEPYDSIETRKQPSGMHCILKHCKQD